MKYELIKDDFIIVNGNTKLFRVKYLANNELGGYIESEKNLSQNGDCRVLGNARVYGNAWLYDDAQVFGDTFVSGNAHVCGNAFVSGDACVFGDTWVFGNAHVFGDARVFGNTFVYGKAQVFDDARVFGDAHVCGNARVFGNAWVHCNARVFDDAQVCGDDWDISPLQIKGSRHYLNASKHGFIQIGCLELSVKEWKEKRVSIGEYEKYTPKEIEEYGLYIDLFEKWFELNNLKEKK